MKGIVLGFDPISGGVIRAEDSKRYVLQSDAWRGVQPPHTGQEVDFEVNGDAASDVYPLKNETAPTSEDVGKMLLSAGKSIAAATSQASAEVSQRLSGSTEHPLAQKILGKEKTIAAWMFGLILVCFFLPFASFSAGNLLIKLAADMSVLEMMIGKTVSLPKFNLFAATQTMEDIRIPGDIRVALIFITTAIGLGVNIKTVPKSALISAGIGVFGLTQILSTRFIIDKLWSDIDKVSGVTGNLAYGLGFWGPLLLFVAVSGLNIWLFFTKKSGR
jgi:hypothetical protein